MAVYDITTANDTLVFETTYNGYNSTVMIDSNHAINFFAGTDSDGFVQVFTINTSTWAVTTANSSLEFDTGIGTYNSSLKIDATHFINFWLGLNSVRNFVQVFTVNTTTWAVTTAGISKQYLNNYGSSSSPVQIDDNHFINFFSGDAPGYGNVQVFTVNTTTWAVTTANSSLTFDTVANANNSAVKIDTNHFINAWTGSAADGYIQVFTVNTSTWAVTTANDSLEYDTTISLSNQILSIDVNHFILIWSGVDSDGFAQVFTVNTSTWAVTTANTAIEFNTSQYSGGSFTKINDNNFVVFYAGGATYDGLAEVLTVNTSTWAITTNSTLNYDSTSTNIASAMIDTSHYVSFWQGASNAGLAQVFTVELPIVVTGTSQFFQLF